MLYDMVIIILVGLNINMVYYYNHIRNKAIQENDLKTKVISLTKRSIQHHIKNYAVSIEKDLMDSINRYQDSNNSYMLLYRFFRNNCSTCVMSDLELIKSNMEEYMDRNILILHYKPKSRNEKIYLKTILHEFNHMSILDSNINIRYKDGIKDQFFGIIDSTGQMKRIYFSMKESPFITKQYLNDISILFKHLP